MKYDLKYLLLKQEFDKYLQDFFLNEPSTNLNDAMQYACLNGGKRIRPLLLLTIADIFKANSSIAMKIALAIELIHCYSLVHDDLPAMDNDELRRGQPTCHVKYGEDVAILVGDSLQAKAFEVILSIDGIESELLISLVKKLAIVVGSKGMVYGQYIDISQNKNINNIDELINMHQLKTGMLIKYAVTAGYLISGNYEENCYLNIKKFSELLGLLFQIKDDILDVTGNVDILGKTINKDIQYGKNTFVTFLSLDGAKLYAQKLYNEIICLTNTIPCNESLLYLINMIYEREN
jgi:geranylgeranyl pyrophosphate synthase